MLKYVVKIFTSIATIQICVCSNRKIKMFKASYDDFDTRLEHPGSSTWSGGSRPTILFLATGISMISCCVSTLRILYCIFYSIIKKSMISVVHVHLVVHARRVALVQWLKLPAWKVGNRGFEPHSGVQVSKKQNVSFMLTHKDLILWGASVTERWRARPQTYRARI